MLQENLIRSIEEQAWIDRVADPVQAAVRGVLQRAPRLADALHGEWLGHPLHAALVAFPVGAFTTALFLDAFGMAGRGRGYQRAADTVTTIGLVGAVAAVLPGLADWSLTEDKAKRVGFVHATLNLVIAGLYGGSLVARARGKRKAGIGLSLAGFTLLLGSAWLGGELSYSLGVGVRREDVARRTRRADREAARAGVGVPR
jgi:uncharacterized membrane protein